MAPKGKTNKGKSKTVTKSLTKTQKLEVKRLVKPMAETKTVVFYSNALGLPNGGNYNDRSYSPQNQYITNTNSDCKRLIPLVLQGIQENQRIGDQISPVSLIIQGRIKINLAVTGIQEPMDIFCVLYVLEHVTLKSYFALTNGTTNVGAYPTGNDFTQLLTNGENTTVPFRGDIWSAHLPVAKNFYKLLKKKVIRLRSAGANLVTAPVGSPAVAGQGFISVANSHDYSHNYTIKLFDKHLPAKIKYPDSLANAPIGANNDPTSYAPFMCMGFYWADGTTITAPQINIEQAYTSILNYKDM